MSTAAHRLHATRRGWRDKGCAVAVACAFFVAAVALLSPGIVTGAPVGDDRAILHVSPMTELGHTPPPHSNSFLYDATYVCVLVIGAIAIVALVAFGARHRRVSVA